MRIFKHLFSILFLLFLMACSCQAEKINGVSFVAASDPADSSHVNPVKKVNANYAAVMPFGFIRNIDHPEIVHNTDRQWFGETRAGTKQYIEQLRKANINVMIKPQIWVWHGQFTGKIMMHNEGSWKALEESYTSFIMEYADLASEVNADIFCIGTELELFIKYRPKYWFNLIKDIREVYPGKLTYAANWDEFWRTPFWSELDFIGVDAYFPVSDKQTPTFEDCMKGWEKYKTNISKLSKEHDKPILFTEYGYRSVDYAGKQPWVADRNMKAVNLEAQINTTKALYEAFWNEEWFAGGFIWKWFIDYERSGGENNHMFTPQNKPVEQVIATYYKTDT